MPEITPKPVPTAHVPAPALALKDAVPISSAFDDVYFSRSGGVAESEYVFLHGNGLPERWQAAKCTSESFTIAELGFGTGINFLVTMRAFSKTAPQTSRLHYIAIEKFPFTPAQLEALLAMHPELTSEAAQLIRAYPLRLPGIHRVHLGNVILTLCFGDVLEMLRELQGFDAGVHRANDSMGGKACLHQPAINAWFLDGFSPAKNTEMWGEAVYQHMARLSAHDATFATFTAASHVRHGLEAAGFAVHKRKGFAHKREMSFGIFKGATLARLPYMAQVKASTGSILVIGAGIAGATLARGLAERGYAVTVIERGHAASGASGNKAGVLFPQITKQWGTASAWYFTAYSYALRQLQHWQAQGLAFEHEATGMLRLPRHRDEETLLQNLQQSHGLDASMVHWLSREDASARAGTTMPTGGAFFPKGTWLNPAQLCAALLQHPNIMLREKTEVTALAQTADGWRASLGNNDNIEAQYFCVTAAYASAALLAPYGIKLGAVGGQVSLFAAQGAASTLRSIICHSGYVIPAGEHILVGATYHRENMLEVSDAHHAQNRAALEEILPNWMNAEAHEGRSSIRATTPDRLPYIGMLDEGLYVSTGHGSRGLLSAPLAAEMIISQMTGQALPVTAQLAHAVRPKRFTKA